MATPIPKNRARFTGAEIALSTGGRLRGEPGTPVCGVAVDSRAVTPGSAFVALRGERHDGHAYVGVARDAGAALLVVRRGAEVPVGVACVEVDDTLAALGRLAAHHRHRWAAAGRRAVVAIAGTVGKTTTKEITAAVLSVRGQVHATVGNLNNVVGLPMTLLGLETEHRLAVVELGSSARGEIALLTRIARPDVAVLTHVSAAHTEHLGDVQDCAEEEGYVLTGAGAPFAVAQADEPWSRALLALSGAEFVRSFGRAADASVRIASSRSSESGTKVELDLPSSGGWLDASRVRRRTFTLPLLGPGSAYGLAAAIATERCVTQHLDLPDWDELYDDVERALASIVAPPGRLVPRSTSDGVLVLDDTYNASPAAVRAALEVAAELARARSGRLVVVLGDMLELGALSDESHAEVGREVAGLGASVFVACGEQMTRAAAAAASAPSSMIVSPLVLAVPSPPDAVGLVRAHVGPGDVVLVKGSRGLRMERVVEGLMAAAPGAGEQA
ncbi:MAG: UDP-N-acetylmuramoyl-tripeptide--D-alanyl-D-alanine ligase [Deltaproteobacteria bacterium]|nr:UDP-N-acetylmuramoyl-tripeptide--D-alanyl-D-alanine ligase [Deltaproteobacteria bacterium]